MRCMQYRKCILQQLRLRQQRYRIGISVDSEYYQNKNIALLRAGEAAAEARFATITKLGGFP